MSGRSLLRIIDYGPYRDGESPGSTSVPTFAQIDADLQEIAGLSSTNNNQQIANTVRIYSLSDGQAAVVQVAQKYGLNVIPSVYLDNPNSNRSADPRPPFSTILAQSPTIKAELDALVTLLNDPKTNLSKIPFVVIGNEEITQAGGWYDGSILDAIAYVRSRTPPGIKFTTAESAGGQYISPALATNPSAPAATTLGLGVDVIYANILPYWESVPISQAIAQVVTEYNQLVATYPGKEVVISETGWPSGGSSQGTAQPGLANEQAFWQAFIPVANQLGIQYGAFEFADEAWKASSIPGNTVDATWGLYGNNRLPKTSVTTLLGSNIGGNGQFASDANDISTTGGPGSTFNELDDSRVDVTGTGVTVNVGNSDNLGLAGSANTAVVSGTMSNIWIGGNGRTASNANDDRVTLAQGGTVFQGDNSRLDVSGNGVTVNVGNSDNLGLAGSANIASVPGSGSNIWIGGNNQSASNANDNHAMMAQGGMVFQGDNSRLDVTGTGVIVNVGNSDNLGVAGSANTANVSGNGSNDWIGGNGQNATNANDNHVTLTQAGTVFQGDNSRLDVSGTGVMVNVGNSDNLGLAGSADMASVSGIGSNLWIGGNGQNASDSNDDHVTMTQGGTVYEGDNSRLDVSGTGVTVNIGNSDNIGLAGSANTASVSGKGSNVWIGGNGQNATNANDAHVTMMQVGTVFQGDNSRLDVSGNGVTVNGGNSDNLGLAGSANKVSVSGKGCNIWIGGNGQTASNANTDSVTLAQGGVVNEGSNSRVSVTSNNATINLGNNASLILTSSLGTIGFITGMKDTLSITASAGSQSVSGFNVINGDQIDLSTLLAGASLAHDLGNLSNYVSVVGSGSSTTLSIAGPSNSDTVVLAGVGLTLQNLINGNGVILPPH